MLPSRRAIFKHANSFRYNYATHLSSLSNKNLQFEATAAATPEDISQVHKTKTRPERIEVDFKAEGSSGERKREMRRREEGKMDEAKDAVKGAAVGAIETGVELGRIGKKVMDGMWEAAEKTAHSVIDSITDDRNNRRRSSDKFVDDLRRRGGGYDDLKDR